MLHGTVYYSDNMIKKELTVILQKFPYISVHFCSKISEIESILLNKTLDFFIITIPDPDQIKLFKKIYYKTPQAYYIYYSHELSMKNIHFSDLSYFSYIIVGTHCKTNLSAVMKNLTSNYWKKIPYDKLGLSYHHLSERLKNVMNYIENHDLKECNIIKIADSLRISPGYFSQEFKRETRMTFRKFMQTIINHYEDIMFEKLEMPTKTAAKILGYSELSSFSRSYKKRKGYPPSFIKNFYKTHKKVMVG